MQASKDFEAGLKGHQHLEVIGHPTMSVVAFRAKQPKRLDIFKMNDNMTARGWHLSALQLPSALHMCFTAQHVGVIAELLKVNLAFESPVTSSGQVKVESPLAKSCFCCPCIFRL